MYILLNVSHYNQLYNYYVKLLKYTLFQYLYLS